MSDSRADWRPRPGLGGILVRLRARRPGDRRPGEQEYSLVLYPQGRLSARLICLHLLSVLTGIEGQPVFIRPLASGRSSLQ